MRRQTRSGSLKPCSRRRIERIRQDRAPARTGPEQRGRARNERFVGTSGSSVYFGAPSKCDGGSMTRELTVCYTDCRCRRLSAALQPPQFKTPPHGSGTVPHCTPIESQVLDLQPQRIGLPPPPHVSGSVQLPHVSVPEQPSLTVPHSAPSSAHVFGVQGVEPHLPGPAPPHNVPVGHAGQVISCPQPFCATPHSMPSSAHVFGWQPHLFAAMTAQLFGALQPPQSRVLPQPSAIRPHSAPRL